MLTSWGALVINILHGFIVPRLIDRSMSQQELGIWDLSWNVVAYFGLINMGLTSSVNRYIAKYAAVNDYDSVNRTFTSIFGITVLVGIFIIVISLIVSFPVIDLIHFKNSADLKMARWIIFTLGASMGISTILSPFGGLLTGNHRWDLHNQAYSATNIMNFVFTLAALYLNFGLIGCALANLIAETVGWGMRVYYSFSKFRYLNISKKYFSYCTVKEMVKFGGKTFIPRVGELISNQSINMLITAKFGTAALALYSRPRALIRIIQTFIMKYALVFTPAASSIQSSGKKEELKELFIRAQFYSNVLCLPAILFLMVMGGPLLELWMGANYRNSVLIAVMAFSQFTLIANATGYSIISGLNKHGRLGIITLIGQCFSLMIAWVMINCMNFNLKWIPLAIGIPMTIIYGFYLPFFACKELGIKFLNYTFSVYKVPLLCMIPYLACLVLSRIMLSGNVLIVLFSGTASGVIVLMILYWKYVLPRNIKTKIINEFLKKCKISPKPSGIKM